MIRIEWLINKIVTVLIRSLLVNTGFLIGAFVFLWCFYSAVADRIFSVAGTALTSSPGIVNPLAYKTAFESGNLLVLFLPFIPFCVVVLIHYFLNDLKRLWIWFAIVCVFIFAFDLVVGLVSSWETHNYLLSNQRDYEKSWTLWFGGKDYAAHVAIVILCGFGGAFIAGLLYDAVRKKVNVFPTDTDINDFTDIDIEE